MVKKLVTQDTPAVAATAVNPDKSGAGKAAPVKETAVNTAIPKPEPRQPVSQPAASAPAPSTAASSAPAAKPATPSTPATKPAAPSTPAPSAPAAKPAAPSTAAPRAAAGEAEKPPARLETAKDQAAEVKPRSTGPAAQVAPVQPPPAAAPKLEEIPAAGAETVEPVITDTSSPVDAALAADRAAAAQFFGEPVEPPAAFKESPAFEEIGPVVEVEALVGEATPIAEPPVAAPPPEPEAYRYFPPPLENKYLNKEALRDRFWLRKAFMPIISYVGRLDFQKGVHLIRHALFYALHNNAQFVLLGVSPEGRINDEFWALKHQLNDSPDCHLELGFNEELSHLIYAGSDMIVMPSLYEPCGLTQMIALKYGAVPIVRSVGGLADTVFDRDYSDRPYHERNGYVFHHAEPHDLEGAMHRAIGLWYAYPDEFRQLMINGMKYDYSWNHPGWHYWNIYEYIRCK